MKSKIVLTSLMLTSFTFNSYHGWFTTSWYVVGLLSSGFTGLRLPKSNATAEFTVKLVKIKDVRIIFEFIILEFPLLLQIFQCNIR